MRCTSIAGVLVAWLAIYSIAPAQSFSPGLQSIDTPFDPRSIAAGESFVAVRKNRFASTYNPAGLSGIEGVSLSFSRRNFNHIDFTSEFKHIAFTGTVSTCIADFAVVYDRYYQGEFSFTTPEFPDGGGTIQISDYVLGISAAREIFRGVDVGMQIKTFRPVYSVTSGSLANFTEANNPIFLDLGIIGTLDGQMAETFIGYTASAGLAIQNFGTDLKESPTNPMSEFESEHILTVPRTMRAGLAFTVSAPRLSGLGLSPVSIMVTGEYRLILNSRVDPKDTFWGFGAEVVILEILTGRFGGFLQNVDNIYGVKDNPALRYGAGMRIPFGMMGLGTPLSLHVDYAAIPLNARVPFFVLDNTTLHAFSVGVVYEADVFPASEE